MHTNYCYNKPGRACYQPVMAKPTRSILPGWDMYEFHLTAVATSRKAGLLDQARELHQRGLDAPSFYHMWELVQEYVTSRTS